MSKRNGNGTGHGKRGYGATGSGVGSGSGSGTEVTALEALRPRAVPRAADLIEALKADLSSGGALGFYERMEHNRNVRRCWWPGQHQNGRKGQIATDNPMDIFPWKGAADNRVHLVDEIIEERVDLMMAALDRSEQRVFPRNLDTDEEVGNTAVMWQNTLEYYLDDDEGTLRQETRKFADVAEEFGHALMYIGWKEEAQLEKRTIAALELTQMMVALEEGKREEGQGIRDEGESFPEPSGGTPGARTGGTPVSPEQELEIQVAVETEMMAMLEDPGLREGLVRLLMIYDPEMPVSEARRVAAGLQKDAVGPVEYYVPTIVRAEPEYRVLRPFVDVFYPATTTRAQKAARITMGEWVTDVELRARVETLGYDAKWVEKVLEHAGRSILISGVEGLSASPWVMCGGTLGTGIVPEEFDKQVAAAKLYQILHVYYRSTAMAGVPAMYHTVVHGQVEDCLGLHECQPYVHGRYPFADRVRQQAAAYLLDSQGVPEISSTDQQEVKTQRDMRSDNASMKILPPMHVPLNQAGGRVNVRPGIQIPRRLTGGGTVEKIDLSGNGDESQAQEVATLESVNRYWCRGMNVDPVMKQLRQQVLVNDFLSDVRAARKLTFQLIQQFAPLEIKASGSKGLPIDLEATRDEIQGQVSMNLEFDVGDLDLKVVGQKLELLNTAIRPLDTEGQLPVAKLLGLALRTLVPGWARLLQREPGEVAQTEVAEEQEALNTILNGVEAPYVPGKNHALRLQVLEEAVTKLGPDGKPTRVQRILAVPENEDVRLLLENRMKFHAFQVKQNTENAQTGRLGVERVME